MGSFILEPSHCTEISIEVLLGMGTENWYFFGL